MKKNKDAQIYILTHRKSLIEENSLYTPLQIGADYNENIYVLKDNQLKDNISKLNPIYCDVCGIYYIYKNLLKEKYIGICGLRRYLDINENEDFDNIFKDYDIIINNYIELKPSVIETYYIVHNRIDIDIVTRIINEYYPEYMETWKSMDYIYPYNCYMTKKEIFEDYCKFLFNILNNLFKILNIKNVEDAKNHVFNSYKIGMFDYHIRTNTTFKTLEDFLNYQMNIGGFLNERLLSLYIIHNKLRILNREIIFTEKYNTFVNDEKN